MHLLIPVVFFLTASVWASSSSYSATEQILSLDNVTVTLSFGSRLESCKNCNESDELCGACCPPRAGLPDICHPICATMGETCTNNAYGKFCCGILPCNNNRCGELDAGIDFVVVAKVALAAALIITMVAVVSICYKGIVRPRCTRCCGSAPEGDNESITSVRRYVRQLMDNRPPRYEFQPEKPPSYEECVGGSLSGASSLSDPPPYSVAVNVSEDQLQDNACALPLPYVIDENASTHHNDLLSTPLNVQCFQVQDSASVSTTGEVFVMSPISDMDDFVAFSESDSADSISYEQLNSDTPTRIETPPVEQINEGIDNATFVPDEVNQQTIEPLER